MTGDIVSAAAMAPANKYSAVNFLVAACSACAAARILIMREDHCQYIQSIMTPPSIVVGVPADIPEKPIPSAGGHAEPRKSQLQP